ncbi:MAG: ABC transporter permease [Gemmatimonadaceae bacterium]|nr:ABC transporter permease [Gemmatimonadaceae bacterium]
MAALLSATLGLNLVVFTFVNALWLRPLPFRDPDRVVTIVGTKYWRIDASIFSTFEAVAGQVATDGINGLQTLTVRLAQDGTPIDASGVTSGYFNLLGIPVRGRDFAASDDQAGAEPVAIISDRAWTGIFHRRDLIGSVIATTPKPLRVIGIAPPGFDGARRGESTDVWIPSAIVPELAHSAQEVTTLDVIARLRPGDTVTDANQRFRLTSQSRDAQIVPLSRVFGGPESNKVVIQDGGSFAVVGGLALLVLCGGCAALAAFLLVHYERRRLEFAIRGSLGASRAQLVLGLIGELSATAALGVLGALGLAWVGIRALPALRLADGIELARLNLSIDWRVVGCALAAIVASLGTAAWLPVARFTRQRYSRDLVGGSTTTASADSQRIRQGLLTVLVSATVVVLIAAALFVQTVRHGFGGAAGIDGGQIVFARFRVPSPSITDIKVLPVAAVAAKTNALRAMLSTVSGVESVAVGLPPIDPTSAVIAEPPVRVKAQDGEHSLRIGRLTGSSELRATLNLPILAGRDLQQADGVGSPVPALLTQSVARRLWPTQNPLGQALVGQWPRGRLQIVGIVPDFAYGTLVAPAEGVAITVSDSNAQFGITPRFVIRTTNSAAATALEIRRVLAEKMPDVYPMDVLTMEEAVARDLGRQRLGAWFFSGFGAVALFLGLGSVFGLVSYLAESRQRECAVRAALGAASSDLVWLGARAAMTPVTIGVAIGLGLAMVMSRVFAALLVGMTWWDPATYVTVAIATISAAGAAAWIGAWRLRRVMPADALRVS